MLYHLLHYLPNKNKLKPLKKKTLFQIEVDFIINFLHAPVASFISKNGITVSITFLFDKNSQTPSEAVTINRS